LIDTAALSFPLFCVSATKSQSLVHTSHYMSRTLPKEFLIGAFLLRQVHTCQHTEPVLKLIGAVQMHPSTRLLSLITKEDNPSSGEATVNKLAYLATTPIWSKRA